MIKINAFLARKVFRNSGDIVEAKQLMYEKMRQFAKLVSVS